MNAGLKGLTALVFVSSLTLACHSQETATQRAESITAVMLVREQDSVFRFRALRDEAESIRREQISGAERAKRIEQMVGTLDVYKRFLIDSYSYINALEGENQIGAFVEAVDYNLSMWETSLCVNLYFLGGALEEQAKEEADARTQLPGSYERLGKATQKYLELASMLVAMADERSLARDEFEKSLRSFGTSNLGKANMEVTLPRLMTAYDRYRSWKTKTTTVSPTATPAGK